MQLNTPKRSAGFTLVEIAIVLVIIGLLLGGVLKGQEMIENGKVKNAVNDLNGTAAAYNSYYDRFRRVPGDDGPDLSARGGNWAVFVAGYDGVGNNNGVLGPITAAQAFAATGTNDEADAFWMQLKAAGFITGNPADNGVTALPRNAFNGLTAITTDATVMGNMPGTKVCMSQVPGKAAQAIDTQLDDGVGNTGSIRNTVGTAGTNTAPGASTAAYSEDNEYTICRRL